MTALALTVSFHRNGRAELLGHGVGRRTVVHAGHRFLQRVEDQRQRLPGGNRLGVDGG